MAVRRRFWFLNSLILYSQRLVKILSCKKTVSFPFLALHEENDRIQRMQYVSLAFKYIQKTDNDFRSHMYDNIGHRWDRWSLYTDLNSPGSDSLRRTDEFFKEFLK